MSTTQDPQAAAVVSDRLPVTVTSSGGDEPFLAAGFTFGEPGWRNPLLRPATLPVGWARKRASSNWSTLVDEYGRERVRIFHNAHMSWITRWEYLMSLLRTGGTPVLDDDWLPAQKAIDELEQIATEFDVRSRPATLPAGWARTAEVDSDYWLARAREHRDNAAKARALAAQISQQ